MKASSLVLQLVEARPKRKKKVPPPEDAAPAPAPEEAQPEVSAADELKSDALATYEEDWRFRALDEFNIEQGTEFHIDDDKAEEDDRMWFRDGHTDWYIYKDSNAGEAEALRRVKQDLEDQPEIFSADFIQRHVNQEKLKNTLWQDVREHRSEDFDEMDDDDKANELERAGVISDASEAFITKKEFLGVDEQKVPELFAEFIQHLRDTTTDEAAVAKGFQSAEQFIQAEHARLSEMDDEDFIKALIADSGFPIDEDDYFSEEQDGLNDEVVDRAKEAYLDKLGEDFDPMEWLNDIYGEEDAQKQAIEIGGIDIEEAAKDAIASDGWSHFMSSYDGNTYDLPSGAVYYRS